MIELTSKLDGEQRTYAPHHKDEDYAPQKDKTENKSLLVFECETWKSTNIITRKLQVFVNKVLFNFMAAKGYIQ